MTTLAVLIAILDIFVKLSTWISRLIGYFCSVLTADGKLDCAPK
jgi:hypothetical protein